MLHWKANVGAFGSSRSILAVCRSAEGKPHGVLLLKHRTRAGSR
jgi:hypothetical protein